MEQAASNAEKTPTVLYDRDGGSAVLVVDQVVVCTVPTSELVLALLGAYYVLDINYPKGYNRFFSALEIFVFDKVPKKVARGFTTHINFCCNFNGQVPAGTIRVQGNRIL